MKFIREHRTPSRGEYVYEYEVTGICTDHDPRAFNLVATDTGYISIEETNFFELWEFSANNDIEISITTKFEYLRMTRLKKGIFIFLITGVSEIDAATLAVKFSEHINRNY